MRVYAILYMRYDITTNIQARSLHDEMFYMVFVPAIAVLTRGIWQFGNVLCAECAVIKSKDKV